jgi:hypothetical protein
MGVKAGPIICVYSYDPLTYPELLDIYNGPNLPFCLCDPFPISMDGKTFMEVVFNILPHNPNVEGNKRFATISDIVELVPSLGEVLQYDPSTTVLLEYAYADNFQKKWSLTVYLPMPADPLKFALDPEGNII